MHAGEFVIRKADLRDSPDILACLRSAFEPFRADYTPGAFIDTVLTPDSLALRFRLMQIFVAASIDGSVIGTVACHVSGPEQGHIRGMAVDPAKQWGGIGKALLDLAEAELLARGCLSVTLETTRVLTGAGRFYEKNGYRLSGTVFDFFGMPLYEYVKELKREY